MKIIKFPECNTTYAKDQKEYLPLPAHKKEDGTVISCWQLTLKERIKVLFSGKIFFALLTFNRPLQPQRAATSFKEVL